MESFAEIQTQLSRAHEMIGHIFIDLFPRYGFAVREAQVRLSHEMLDALYNRSIAITEAGVGIGKTYAYLVALIVHHISLPESWWVRTSYRHDSRFNMSTPMPVIISTSSIALQKAIMQEYVPFLSRVLLENGVITNPLQCVIRKGKSNYVCEKLLRRHLIEANLDQKNPKQREALLSLTSIYDLDRAQGLSAHDRNQVCVPQYCSRKCSDASTCRFQRILQSSKSPAIFFQICNHNYLLADIIHRRTGKEPLLPNYMAIVIDEAHKLHDAALQMYGHILEKDDILLMAEHVRSIKFCTRKLIKSIIHMEAAADAFFVAIAESAKINADEEIQRFQYTLARDMKAKLFSLILSIY